MKKLEKLNEIKEKLSTGKKLLSSDAHQLCELIDDKLKKKEHWRIWNELCNILEIDDYGDLVQGDEVHKIIFKNDSPIEINSKDFDSVVRPVINYLCKNHHPHVAVIITPTNAELLEGIKSTGQVLDYIVD